MGEGVGHGRGIGNERGLKACESDRGLGEGERHGIEIQAW